MEGHLIRGWDAIVAGCWWLPVHQRISHQLLGVGIPFPAGMYQSPVGRSYRGRKADLIRILPGCGGTSTSLSSTNLLKSKPPLAWFLLADQLAEGISEL